MERFGSWTYCAGLASLVALGLAGCSLGGSWISCLAEMTSHLPKTCACFKWCSYCPEAALRLWMAFQTPFLWTQPRTTQLVLTGQNMKLASSRPRWEFMILWLLTTSLPFPSQLLGGGCWYDSRAQEVGTTRQVSVDPGSLPGIEPLRQSAWSETFALVFGEPRNGGLLWFWCWLAIR